MNKIWANEIIQDMWEKLNRAERRLVDDMINKLNIYDQRINDIKKYLSGYDYNQLTDESKIIAKDVSLILDGTIKIVK